MSVGSIFYHFIDARRREPVGVDDFRAWLMGLGARLHPALRRLAEVDPYFESLYVLRDHLARSIRRATSAARPSPEPSDRPGRCAPMNGMPEPRSLLDRYAEHAGPGRRGAAPPARRHCSPA